MLIQDTKHFIIGLIMAIVFVIVLVVMSGANFGGKNAFDAADRLYNSIAKGSSYKIPTLERQAREFIGTNIDILIPQASVPSLARIEKLLARAGAQVSAEDGQLRLQGDLGNIALAALKDSEAMYRNDDRKIIGMYGFTGKEALYTWWEILKESLEFLKWNKQVDEASFLDEVVKKGVEVGYNFFGIAPEKAGSKTGILIFSLCFYIAYTIWWGFAIFFLFEGFGLSMEAGKKEEA
jgi:hypothetical protein